MFDAQSSLADIAGRRPHLTMVLEEWGLDYCSAEPATLHAACHRQGIDSDAVLEALRRAKEGSCDCDLSSCSPSELVEYIGVRHHQYLRAELPVLEQRLERALQLYGQSHRQIGQLAPVVRRLVGELRDHMQKEEWFAFPWISSAGQPDEWVLASLSKDHTSLAFILNCIRFITGNFRLPANSGPAYQALYACLKGVEKDVRQHLYLETNLLLPRLAS